MSETAELSHNSAVGKGPPVCSGTVPSQAGRLTDSAPSPLATWGWHTLSKQRCWNLDVKNGDVSGNPAIMAEGRLEIFRLLFVPLSPFLNRVGLVEAMPLLALAQLLVVYLDDEPSQLVPCILSRCQLGYTWFKKMNLDLAPCSSADCVVMVFALISLYLVCGE